MRIWIALVVLLMACSETNRSGIAPAVSSSRSAAGSVSQVRKVRVSAGFSVWRTGARVTAQDGMLVTLTDLPFAPVEAARARGWIVGDTVAFLLETASFHEEVLLVPLPAPDVDVNVWESSGHLGPEDMAGGALEAERQAALSEGRRWFTVRTPGVEVTSTTYATLAALQFEVRPVRISSNDCVNQIGKECGVFLDGPKGPVECVCPEGLACTPSTHTCLRPARL